MVRTWGGAANKGEDKKWRSHLEIGEMFDLLDFQSAAKLTGNKFVYLKNEAAILELALVNWALNLVAKKGFTPMTTPDLAKTPILEACGFQPRDDSSQVYQLDGKADCLIGTAEIPLAGMFTQDLLRESALPLKYVAYSHCFRKEAGRGQHSQGLYRLHQFSKVEMFAFTENDYGKSEGMLGEMVDIQEEIA